MAAPIGWLIMTTILRTAVPAAPEFPTSPPAVSAKAAILMAARTGQILYEKDAFREMDPASLTKMMTALVVIDHGHLRREAAVSSRATKVEGSKLHIRPGQRYTLEDLLRGLLLRSGNDAAIALAEADAGSVEKFVAEMNQRAEEVGAFNTAFQNPNGLTAPGHYSTAYDLALIARAAMNRPLFRHLVAQKEQEVRELSSGATRKIRTTNRLLYEFPGGDGIKTGTTQAAGRCLAASASRDGEQLIAVVLKSKDRWQDGRELLEWGFRHFETRPVYQRGHRVDTVRVVGGVDAVVPVVAVRTLWATMPRGTRPDTVKAFPRRLWAPVATRPVGRVFVIPPDGPPRSVTVRPAHRVAARNPVRSLWSRLWSRSGAAAGKEVSPPPRSGKPTGSP